MRIHCLVKSLVAFRIRQSKIRDADIRNRLELYDQGGSVLTVKWLTTEKF